MPLLQKFAISSLCTNKNERSSQGGLTQGFIRSKEALFPQYCVKKPRQASALPWFFILSCRKISPFGVLRSFEIKIFSHRNSQRTQKYWMYFKDDGFAVGKKILSKPYKSLCESAQRLLLILSESSCVTALAAKFFRSFTVTEAVANGLGSGLV